MCFNQAGDISTREETSLKLVDKFTYLGSSVSSTEKDIDTRLAKAWTAIDKLSIIWKSDQTDKMKLSFFQAVVVSILLYGCITWTLTKRLEKKIDGNYTRMLHAILNKSWRQHPSKHQLYGHRPPITKIIQVRRTRHAGHCWRSRNELISDVLLWTPTYGRAKAGRPARTYIQQVCEDTGCSPEDLTEAMNDREKLRERVRDIRASGTTWWWWWLFRITWSVIYYAYTYISGNIIRHSFRTSMNERTHFFIKIYISHFILERADVSMMCERWVEGHILWERTSSHVFFQEPGLPTAAPLASSSETTSVRLHVPRSTAILCPLSKSDRVVLITWQLVKAHGVTRNEPKICVICYIKGEVYIFFFLEFKF